MSDILKPGVKLEKTELWQLSKELAEYSYAQLDKFPEEEKWGMQSKLRHRAFDLTNDIAEAIGSIDPRDKTQSYGMARRNLFGIKNIYNLAYKTDFLEADPDVMVKIDTITDLLDTEIGNVTKDIQGWYEEFDDKRKKQQ